MDPIGTLNWPRSRPEAYGLQEQVSREVRLMPLKDYPELVAAVDTAYGFAGETIYVSAVVTTFPELEEVERQSGWADVSFPFVPGLLFYREGPAIVEVLSRLHHTPDLIIVQGHGIAHPAGCGIAGHVGVLYDCPTIGCCRRLLAGRHRDVALHKGSVEPIIFRGQEVGVAYRSKDNVKPIFISPGHLSDIETSQDIIVRCLRGFRLPEPLRYAHSLANGYKRHLEKKRPRNSEQSTQA